jgi:hypothetical protein
LGAAGGHRSSASDTTFAAAKGCASGGSSGGGDSGRHVEAMRPWINKVENLLGVRLDRTQTTVWVANETDLADAERVFKQLSEDGRRIESSSYPGELVELADGTRIGLRPVSASGEPTIDVNPAGSRTNYEIKFRP